MTADNGQPFKYGYDSVSGKYGYYTESGGADTFHPFSTGEADALYIAGAITSTNALFISNGVSSYYGNQNRAGIISLINNGACPFLANASAVSGTDGIISVQITRAGWYMVAFDRTYNRGNVVQYSENQYIQTSCTDNIIRYLGDTNPFA